ncbi:MAG: hypothetical protein IKS32_12330 [Solobacterium sp.]|nr:hypothetical protein [Solobacterium sp.]
MKKSEEELYQTPYWIIDILPERVMEKHAGSYSAVEQYYLRQPRLAEVKKKHINVILKLNCYRDLYIGEEQERNPSPDTIAHEMRNRYLCIFAGEAMIVSEPDELYMTLYNPDESLLNLIRMLAFAEGLFVWKPEEQNDS